MTDSDDDSQTRSCKPVRCLDVTLFALFLGLGVGSWTPVNGIFQELPVIALTTTPVFNVSQLYSYGALLVAGANIYPVCYLLILSYAPCLRRKVRRKACLDKYMTVIVLLAGSLCCALLANYWATSADEAPALFFFLIFQVCEFCSVTK